MSGATGPHALMGSHRPPAAAQTVDGIIPELVQLLGVSAAAESSGCPGSGHLARRVKLDGGGVSASYPQPLHRDQTNWGVERFVRFAHLIVAIRRCSEPSPNPTSLPFRTPTHPRSAW